jgi:hypothetical protein
MRWDSLLLAGTALLALPYAQPTPARAGYPAAAAFAPNRAQANPEGNLPADRYLELRTRTLGHAHLIAGPRLKNPNLSSRGIDRNISVILAEQRADRLNRSGIISLDAGPISDRSATLLLSVAAGQAPQQTRAPLDSKSALKQSTCARPAIRAVNGHFNSPVFTPAEPDNHYRITGCGFGSTPGVLRLQPGPGGPSFGSTSQPITLQLDTLASWTDDHIDVHINPNLIGLPDFTADLVIELPNGHTIQMPHCQFVAVRGEPQLLRAIPAAWVRLDATSLSVRAIRQVEFESPPVPGEELPPEAAGSSAFIARSDPQAFATGKDNYDLSQLAPGWAIESVQLRVFDAVCPGENKSPVSNGSWETTWTARGFVIAWADETCRSPIPPVFNFTLSSSQYATNVWVIGPAGTQPLPNSFSAARP